MSKKERLLRIAGLIIILRDELEDVERLPEWVQVANDYLDMLTGKNEEVNEEYNLLFHHIDSVICEVDTPFNLIDDLFKILQNDMKRCKVTHPIKKTTEEVFFCYDVKMVKLLDSKIRLV
jgi:hypothetical protein